MAAATNSRQDGGSSGREKQCRPPWLIYRAESEATPPLRARHAGSRSRPPPQHAGSCSPEPGRHFAQRGPSRPGAQRTEQNRTLPPQSAEPRLRAKRCHESALFGKQSRLQSSSREHLLFKILKQVGFPFLVSRGTITYVKIEN